MCARWHQGGAARSALRLLRVATLGAELLQAELLHVGRGGAAHVLQQQAQLAPKIADFLERQVLHDRWHRAVQHHRLAVGLIHGRRELGEQLVVRNACTQGKIHNTVQHKKAAVVHKMPSRNLASSTQFWQPAQRPWHRHASAQMHTKCHAMHTNAHASTRKAPKSHGADRGRTGRDGVAELRLDARTQLRREVRADCHAAVARLLRVQLRAAHVRARGGLLENAAEAFCGAVDLGELCGDRVREVCVREPASKAGRGEAES